MSLRGAVIREKATGHVWRVLLGERLNDVCIAIERAKREGHDVKSYYTFPWGHHPKALAIVARIG